MKNFYNTLGIEINATNNEIKKAYKLLMLENHPDKKKENYDVDLFKEIQLAYEMLIDTDVRIAYNKYISNKGFENNIDLFLNLKDQYAIFQKFYNETINIYSREFNNSFIELYEYIDIELCYIYLSNYAKFKKYVQNQELIYYYILYRELEVKKRFTFYEALFLYARMLEERYITFDEFFSTMQENYNETEKISNSNEKVDMKNHYNSHKSDDNSTFSKKRSNRTVHIIMIIVIFLTSIVAMENVKGLESQICTPFENIACESINSDIIIAYENVSQNWLLLSIFEICSWIGIIFFRNINYKQQENYNANEEGVNKTSNNSIVHIFMTIVMVSTLLLMMIGGDTTSASYIYMLTILEIGAWVGIVFFRNRNFTQGKNLAN